MSGEGLHELVNGELVEMPRPNPLHAAVAARLCRLLAEHVDERAAGKVLAEAGFVLELPYDRRRVRGPDLAFVSSGKLPPGRLPETFLRGAPDLAVEILSPSDRSAELEQKLRDYFEAGARLVWVVAPQAMTATVYRADGSARLVREGGVLDGGDVLPGLTIPLARLFD
jgi:Uma2 family endonuclease